MDALQYTLHFCSPAEQNVAAQLCANQARRPLSERNPTYIHFISDLNQHHAAVQITITPLSLPQIQKQTIFYPRYRYVTCCRDISLEDAQCRIEKAVQCIIDAFYQIGRWDLSNKECYTRDFQHPLDAVEATCLSSAKSLLHRYILSITRDSGDDGNLDVNGEDSFVSLEGEKTLAGPKNPCTSTPSKNLDGQKRKASLSRREKISNHDNPEIVGLYAAGQKQKRQKINDMGVVEDLEPAPAEPAPAEPAPAEPAPADPVPDAGAEADEEVNRLASKFISKFFEGIKSLASMPKSVAHLQVQDCTQDYFIEQLVQNSNEIKNQGRSLSWCYLFLAGTIWSSRRSLPTQTVGEVRQDCSQAKRTAIRWGGTAKVVNAVVKILYPNWKIKAYLVYHALAAKHYALSDIASLSKGKHPKVVKKIVEGLHDRQPDNLVVEWPLFDPALHLSQLLKFEYEATCSALGLPSLGQLPVATGTSMTEQIQYASLDQPPLSGRILTEGQWGILSSNDVTLQSGTSESPMISEELWRLFDVPMMDDESWRAMFNLRMENSMFPMINDESSNALRLNESVESRRASYLQSSNQYVR
ncbi:hypothetical protein ABVK25_010150 [Lepraria finkii]|uniref:Uncharacterized protein n=1 Tax=Lepraria finkii TaxID=1340010 RepID=A0ABR4AVD4_9LECA